MREGGGGEGGEGGGVEKLKIKGTDERERISIVSVCSRGVASEENNQVRQLGCRGVRHHGIWRVGRGQ